MLDTTVQQLEQDFNSIVEAYQLSLQKADDESSRIMLQAIDAMRQNIQIMLRLESDIESGKTAVIKQQEISEIADYALNLLDQIAAGCASRGLQEEMLGLHRLSIPVVIWLQKQGGFLTRLDIVVNAIASYANTLKDPQQLEALSALIQQVIDVTDPEIRRDAVVPDPMRPWRILNLNWGIVATRTHNTDTMRYVFDRLLENIPADVKQFFHEGVQQMDIVDYPQPVKDMMREYAQQVIGDGQLH